MKLINHVLVLAVAAPTLAWSQGTSQPAGAAMQAAFDSMQANVATIAVPHEKERWQANVALWQVRLGHMGKLEKADLGTMQASFDLMKANVAKITAPAEKERWLANRDLWQLALHQTGKMSSADMKRMQAGFETMRANVARISAPAERGRWQANRDLWKGMIDRM